MTKFLTLAARFTNYSPSTLEETMTVGELMELLSEYDEDMEVCLSIDNGYIYGAIEPSQFKIEEEDEEEED